MFPDISLVINTLFPLILIFISTVPDLLIKSAYEDCPLPIGYGQTISQPYIVARMLQVAEVGENDSVLEVGTGCGYAAAVISRIARKVYSSEIIPEVLNNDSNNCNKTTATAMTATITTTTTIVRRNGPRNY